MQHRQKFEKYKDLYEKWHMDNPRVWEKSWVKAAFMDVKEFIANMDTTTTTCASSSQELDDEFGDILEKHRPAGELAACQAIFVALIFETLETKKNDDYGRKKTTLLTHGYKCPLLAFLVSRMLGDETLDPLMRLYQDSSSKNHFLTFFELA